MRFSVKRLLATPVLAVALTVGLMAGNAVPAHATSAAAAVVQGSGTISPGITPTGTNTNSFTFTSVSITTAGVVNNAASVGTSGCGASGGSSIENLALALGSGTWSCSTGVLAGVGGGLTYVRVGAVVPVVLTGGLTGALACVFTANQTPPATITSYGLNCAGAGVN
jgi:hypothetical protein